MRVVAGKALLLVAALLCAADTLAQPRQGALLPGMVNPGYEEKPAWFKSSLLDLGEDIREASASGKRLIVYLYQDGCPYCKKLLEDNFGQHSMVDKTRRHFDVVSINIWGDQEVIDTEGRRTTEKHWARALRVQFTPTMLLFDEGGRVALRLNGYYAPHRFSAALEYVGQRMERKLSFAEYLAQAALEPASGRLHLERSFLRAPYQLAAVLKRSAKPLLVMFEQAQCSACDELHLEVLKRRESREMLARLQVALLDLRSADPVVTPEGQSTNVREWAQALNVHAAPTLVFFDSRGKEVFRAEGYLKAFHVQSVLDYVGSGAYRSEPEFQRYIERRAEELRARGVAVDLMR